MSLFPVNALLTIERDSGRAATTWTPETDGDVGEGALVPVASGVPCSYRTEVPASARAARRDVPGGVEDVDDRWTNFGKVRVATNTDVAREDRVTVTCGGTTLTGTVVMVSPTVPMLGISAGTVVLVRLDDTE